MMTDILLILSIVFGVGAFMYTVKMYLKSVTEHAIMKFKTEQELADLKREYLIRYQNNRANATPESSYFPDLNTDLTKKE